MKHACARVRKTREFPPRIAREAILSSPPRIITRDSRERVVLVHTPYQEKRYLQNATHSFRRRIQTFFKKRHQEDEVETPTSVEQRFSSFGRHLWVVGS